MKCFVKSLNINSTWASNLNIDLSFLGLNGLKNEEVNTFVDWIKVETKKYPYAKALIIIIKNLLKEKGLNIPYKGGLPSIGVIIMVLSYLKIQPRDMKESSLLIGFFSHYSNFNFSLLYVNYNAPMFYCN